MRPRRQTLAVAGATVASIVAACGTILPVAERAPAACDFPQGVPFSHDAATTLGEVGLAHFGGEHVEVRAWVTDVAVPYDDPRMDEVVDTRLICVEIIDEDVVSQDLYVTVPFPATP